MDLNWLDDVLVLLEEQNLTRAAARRNVTQPAFSRRIKCFEDWVGVPVLSRSTNRIEIDPALRANEQEIRALVSRLRGLRSTIAQHDPFASSLHIVAQHASFLSCYPAMALRLRAALPRVNLHVHARNLGECASMLLRGDARMLLCHEAESAAPLRLGAGVARGLWGRDDLIPVVGGVLRDTVARDAAVPSDLPAIVYPEDSYFGSALTRRQRVFGTAALSEVAVCETAFSAGIKELVLDGLGVAWLPSSMVQRELAGGTLTSLASRLGSEPLEIAIYADMSSDIATAVLDILTGDHANRAGPVGLD